MKKTFITLVLFVSILVIGNLSVSANTNNYLPGGTNYLDENNFTLGTNSGFYQNDPFLVKSFTDYTLTVPMIYVQSEDTGVEICMFENETGLSCDYIDSDYFDEFDEDFYTHNFKTTSETNYMTIDFDDDGRYFKNFGFNDFQLEEGNAFTGYQPYQTGNLVDTTAPYFNNVNKIISYYDSPISMEDIKSSLSAYDAIEGDLTASIVVISDNYTANIDTVGVYQCEFEVSDSAGNSSNVIIDIEVVDVLKPVFSDIGIINAVYPNTYTTEDILGMISASDNYDGDLSNQIVLDGENYLSNASIVGDYFMEFSVTDSNGNKENYTQTIRVIDDEAPLINGVVDVSIGYDSFLTEDDILALYEVTDNYDAKETLDLIIESDLYTNNADTLGSYNVILTVTDSSNNNTRKTLTINVVDEIGPVLYMDSSIIQTYTDEILELPDFVNLLVNTKEIDGSVDYSVTVDYDSYSNSSDTPGVYHLSLSLRDEEGEIIEKDFEVRVLERDPDYIHQPEIPEEDGTGYTSNVTTYIIGGILTFMLAATNIIWFLIVKKHS